IFGEIVPIGSSNNTSIRESAVRDAAAEFQPVLEASTAPATLIAPFCTKSLRFIGISFGMGENRRMIVYATTSPIEITVVPSTACDLANRRNASVNAHQVLLPGLT